MKFTMSKDGELRADLLVRFRISKQDIIDALMLNTNYSLEIPTGRAEIIAIVTEFLNRYGGTMWSVNEDYSVDEEKENKIKEDVSK